jgi:LPXTG-motif cell wall-anchored protein
MALKRCGLPSFVLCTAGAFGIVVRAKRRILRALPGKAEEGSMGRGALATSSALATTTAPGTAPGPTTGGIGDYWWAIVVLLVIAAAIWYYMKGRNRV